MDFATFNFLVTVIGAVYGLILIINFFHKTELGEKMRIDPLLFPTPTEKTRIMNLILGLAFFGYNTYHFIKVYLLK